MSDYTENKTPNLIINTLEDPSKLSEITVGENVQQISCAESVPYCFDFCVFT